MSDLALFDADDYGKSKRSPLTVTPPRSSIETEAVVSDATWKLVSKNQPGVVHAYVGALGSGGAMLTFCGTIGVPRTFTPGEIMRGCVACLRMGAPARAGGAA